MKRYIFMIIAMFLTSCTTYKHSYDCPPGEGVACKSVSEIEGMITETKEGPDIFAIADEKESKNKSKCPSCKTKKGRTPLKKSTEVKKVWIEGYTSNSGHHVDGHYVYFSLNEEDAVLESVRS